MGHSSRERNVKHTDLTMSDENPSKNRGSDAAVGIRPQEGADQSNGKQLVRANSGRPLVARNGGITDQADRSSQDGGIKHAHLTMIKGKPSKNRGSEAAVGIRPQEGADQSKASRSWCS